MGTNITRKGPVFDQGLCRCCGNMKKCRILNIEYFSLGQKEVYSDMIMDCFGLVISHLDGVASERLICATCVNRVRDALDFKKQALKCEEAFLQMKIYDGHCNSPDTTIVDTLEHQPKVEVEIVKAEPVDDETHGDVNNHVDDTEPAIEDNTKCDAMDQDSNSNDDLPLQYHINRKTQDNEIAHKNIIRPPGKLASQIMLKQKLPMSKVQQLMRERDPTYMTETNILTIVECSYVAPFKCRHNHLLCYYCGESYTSPSCLRQHINSHSPKKFRVTERKQMIKLDISRIDCRLCPTKIDNLEDFKRHVCEVHGKSYYFDYNDSVLPFKLAENESKCVLCGMVFPYFHALNKHMNVHFSNYVCETCGLGFVDRGRFVMHQTRHEEGDFPCPTCGKIFKAQYNRDLHIDRVHKKRGRVYCPKCDVRLMSYPHKLKHLVEVHGEAPLSFPCDNCERTFETRRNLTIHQRKEHLKDYRYECQCCGQKFFTRFALTNHMPRHTGERNYKCKVCEKTYPRLKTLKDHMRIHTNDRRYRCHVCAQAFIQNCSLKGHMKSQHPEYVFSND